MKHTITLTVAIAALLLATASFILSGSDRALAQHYQAKPYPMPRPCNRIMWNCDSGWADIAPGQIIRLTHNLGGDWGEYFVYVPAAEGNGTCHGWGYGGYGVTGE